MRSFIFYYASSLSQDEAPGASKRGPTTNKAEDQKQIKLLFWLKANIFLSVENAL